MKEPEAPSKKEEGSVTFETERLLLRAWRESDRGPFAAMNADPQVMRYFPSVLSTEETDAMLDRNRAHFARHGFGLWAAEIKETVDFAGFISLTVPAFEAHFTPCVEIGWRLAARFWNRGLATEGATEILRFAREDLRLREVTSFTFVGNAPSGRVMEKIGLEYNTADDFNHPGLPVDHPLSRHVLYRTRWC